MRKRSLVALFLLAGSCSPAFASDAVVFAVPGRPGVPIIVNGVDASYRVIEGDMGLGRNVRPPIRVYGGRRLMAEHHVGGYFPSAGVAPGYGRLEVEPPEDRVLPPRAESFSQSWSAQSAPPVNTAVPLYPPDLLSQDIYSPSHPYGAGRRVAPRRN